MVRDGTLNFGLMDPIRIRQLCPRGAGAVRETGGWKDGFLQNRTLSGYDATENPGFLQKVIGFVDIVYYNQLSYKNNPVAEIAGAALET
jgi:hypothetical protein